MWGQTILKISILKWQITKNCFRYCGFALALQSKKEKQSQCEDLRYLEEERIGQKNAILDGCSTVDSKLDYDGIGWYLMVLHGIRWYFAIE